MSYLLDGVDDYLQVDSPPAGTYPFTMACWFKPADITTDHGLLFQGQSGVTNNSWSLYASGAFAGDPVRLESRNTAQQLGSTSTGFSAGAWQHACGVYTSATSRAVFLGGGGKGTNATSSTPTANRFTVGRRGDSTPDLHMTGRIAEVAVWNIALSDAEVASLATGVLPTNVQAANLIGYWPLLANANDVQAGARHLTAFGGVAVDADHPTMLGAVVVPRRPARGLVMR